MDLIESGIKKRELSSTGTEHPEFPPEKKKSRK